MSVKWSMHSQLKHMCNIFGRATAWNPNGNFVSYIFCLFALLMWQLLIIMGLVSSNGNVFRVVIQLHHIACTTNETTESQPEQQRKKREKNSHIISMHWIDHNRETVWVGKKRNALFIAPFNGTFLLFDTQLCIAAFWRNRRTDECLALVSDIDENNILIPQSIINGILPLFTSNPQTNT